MLVKQHEWYKHSVEEATEAPQQCFKEMECLAAQGGLTFEKWSRGAGFSRFPWLVDGEGESHWQPSNPASNLFLSRIYFPTEMAYLQMQPVVIMNPLSHQLGFLLLIGLPIACISWTVTHEEMFREPREFCKEKSKHCRPLYMRKLFYLFTCEYCFSHYVAALFLILTHFQLLYAGWRGYLVSEFALVWIANLYMSVFNRLRLEIKAENLTIEEHARFASGPEPVKMAK
jgi:hypothetical protein